jgi:hypothetical protein
MRMDSPLERKLRDAHGCANHRWVAHPLYGELGKILLSLEPTTEFGGSNSQCPRPTKWRRLRRDRDPLHCKSGFRPLVCVVSFRTKGLIRGCE